ncbi:hypothetical protein LOTGIDRAFT_132263 [Lottia gigantea]|uniref:G-protein coupled receptors family 1 profile domain-containing protein n=1 Tax=Lottia gigantea TaxID=225164 RepID=V4B729_LOTGI|nr:hypothetical protein LOTGIDRAFT_132263 [Lottia gigantea]ESO84334.1 hypothetical protein LOTGIDRAFT_132263 [Lottia gigantea]
MENSSISNFTQIADVPDIALERILGVIGMATINFLAFWGNFINIVVIVTKPQIRHNLSNLLLLNLCFIEISAAIFLLPSAIVSYYSDSWIFGESFCALIGFLGSLFSFASIANLCVISVERFYSIRFPMHHAAHMSLTKILCMIGFVWMDSLLLSVPPLLGVNSYSFQSYKRQCSFSWGLEIMNKVYVLIVGLLCFIVPALIIFLMHWGIFRVAHKALTRINPGINRQSLQSTNHHKAIKTLSITLTAFVIFWGPYYLYHGYGAIRDRISHRHVIEVIVLWLGYCAYAMNPFLYSFLNRAIRTEVIELYKKILCCRVCIFKDESDEDEDLGDQNFIQFLEGSGSCVGMGQHRSSHSRVDSESNSIQRW